MLNCVKCHSFQIVIKMFYHIYLYPSIDLSIYLYSVSISYTIAYIAYVCLLYVYLSVHLVHVRLQSIINLEF